MTKVAIHVPEPIRGIEVHPFFSLHFGDKHRYSILFTNSWPENFFEKGVQFSKPEISSAIVLPNNFKKINDDIRAYVKKYADLGETLDKPVFLFSHGDFTHKLKFDPRVFVFRYSIYRSIAEPRDIMTPTLVEDLGRKGVSLRSKGETPVVSFCGQASFSSLRRWVGYFVKNFIWDIRALVKPVLRARKQGVYWRRKVIHILRNQNLIRTNFIIRTSYSSNVKSIEVEANRARKEFIESIVNSDFVLCPKGDGNYSNRFQETLSLGRFPVYIETDSMLPFENIVDYDSVVVRVPFNRIKELSSTVLKFYKDLTEGEYLKRQKRAREIFEKYLLPDSFYRRIFTEDLDRFGNG